MATPVSFYGETINDNTRKSNGEPESSSWRVAITTLTSANVAAQTSLLTALSNAVSDVCIGRLAKVQTTWEDNVVSTLPAATTLAQRENKLLLRYHGATTDKKFRISIPCFDLTKLPDNSEFLDLTADEGLALKTAFEAVVKSPDDSSEATVLDSAQFVGRNT